MIYQEPDRPDRSRTPPPPPPCTVSPACTLQSLAPIPVWKKVPPSRHSPAERSPQIQRQGRAFGPCARLACPPAQLTWHHRQWYTLARSCANVEGVGPVLTLCRTNCVLVLVSGRALGTVRHQYHQHHHQQFNTMVTA